MLLPARTSPLLPVYARYGRWLLRRAFARVWVGGAPWPAPGGGAVIGFPNPGAWWDPIVLLLLSHDVFRCDAYGLMQGAWSGRCATSWRGWSATCWMPRRRATAWCWTGGGR